MERSTKVALGITIGVVLFGGCCIAAVALPFMGCSRPFVRRPAVDVVVSGEHGVLSGATVVHTWWSEPHGQVHATEPRTTDTDGRVQIPFTHEQETVMPLCMHGVPWHRHSVCIEAEGYEPLAFEVDDPNLPVTGQLKLVPGAGVCTHDPLLGGTRPDVTLPNARVFVPPPSP